MAGDTLQRSSPSAVLAIVFAAAILLMPMSGADSQPAALTASQSDAVGAYNDAVKRFETILSERQAQIDSKQQLPHLPGQALYLARVAIMSAYKDFTDAMPSRIGRPNKFGIPPAYFDADTEPLIDAYLKLFRIMEAPPADAQSSATPFKASVGWAKRSVPTADLQFALTLTWARRYAPLPTLLI
jgi:hypothetical protein